MAKGVYELTEEILKDIQSNVDIPKKVICTPQAKKQLDLIREANTYGQILANNVIFLTKYKSVK